jgi:predicted Fe-Mo cluster-binding NifX family protein
MIVVAVPSEDDKCLASKVAEHFRSSPYFTIVEIDEKRIQHCQAVKNSDITSPPMLFRSLGVNVALVNRIGPGQLQLLNKIGVSVLSGATADVGCTLTQYLDGRLNPVDKAPPCSGHCAD